MSTIPRRGLLGCALASVIAYGLLDPAASLAATYGYFPNNPLYLGGNFDPTSLNEPRLACISYKSEVQRQRYRGDLPVNADVISPRQTQFDLSQITSRESMYKYLNVSASISGSYGFFSGSGSFEFESQNTFNQDPFTWIVRGYSKFGEFGIDDSASLNPVASDLLQRRGRAAFEARCGTEYVAQITRAALVAAIYTVKNVSQSDMQRLEAQFQASYDSGFWGVEGGAKYKSFFSYARQVGTIEVHVFALGGDGITKLSDAAVYTDDIDKIRNSFKSYLESLTIEKSAVTEYLTGSLKQFSPSLPDFALDSYSRRIGELWLLREDLAAERRKITAFLRASTDYALTPERVDQFRNRVAELNEAISEIENTAENCRYTKRVMKSKALAVTGKAAQAGIAKIDLEPYPMQQQADLYALSAGHGVQGSTAPEKNPCDYDPSNYSLLRYYLLRHTHSR